MKVNALLCIDKLLDKLDKMIILDEVLPFLTEINYPDTEILMAVIGKIRTLSYVGGKIHTLRFPSADLSGSFLQFPAISHTVLVWGTKSRLLKAFESRFESRPRSHFIPEVQLLKTK